MKTESRITKELVQKLYDSELLWYFMAGLRSGEFVVTYDEDEAAIQVARDILQVLPEIKMDDETRKKVKSFLENTIIDTLEFDLSQREDGE